MAPKNRDRGLSPAASGATSEAGPLCLPDLGLLKLDSGTRQHSALPYLAGLFQGLALPGPFGGGVGHSGQAAGRFSELT